MQLRWRTVDKWREELGLTKADFARRSGVPENTIHRGLKFNSKLQPTTIAVIRQIFPEKFKAESDQ